MEIIYLFEGEIQSEQLLQSMCVLDNDANPRFRVDFNKFFAGIQSGANQASRVGGTGGAGGAGAQTPAANTP